MIDKYLEEHSLSKDFVEKVLGWRFDEEKISIPVYDTDGTLLFTRYRHLTGTTKFSADKGSHPTLYALQLIKDENNIILCEGEPDAARLWQEGIPATTATSGVKTFSEKLVTPLMGKTVSIILDNDEAGFSTIEKYYNTLNNAGIDTTILTLPKEYKDTSEFFTAGHTKEEFLSLTHFTMDEWIDAHTPEEYQFEEGTELLSRKLPPEEWLVDRILPTEGFAFIIGAEATGKSFYTLTLADAVAKGHSWLNQFQVKEKQKVLIIDKENTKRRTQQRMKGLLMLGNNIFWLKYPHFFEVADPNEEDGFSQIAKAASRKVKKEGIKFIIVDSFADIMIGNENAAGDVQKFFDSFRQLFPGCSILVLHHASKPAPGVVRNSSQRARGSTNIMAQVYSAFYVESVPKSKTEFILEQTKAGDAEKLNKFKVELHVVDNPIDPSKTIVSSIDYKGEVFDQEMKNDEAKEAIEEAFKSTSQMARQDLMDVLASAGISERTAKRAIKELTDGDKLKSIPDPVNKVKRIIVWVEDGDDGVYTEDE